MPKQALEGRQIQARSDDFLSPLPGLVTYPTEPTARATDYRLSRLRR